MRRRLQLQQRRGGMGVVSYLLIIEPQGVWRARMRVRPEQPPSSEDASFSKPRRETRQAVGSSSRGQAAHDRTASLGGIKELAPL